MWSNKGARRPAIPNWLATSRPRSRGILEDVREGELFISRITESAPCPLVLSIASLNDFMLTRENFLLENLCTSTFVDTGDFEDLSGVDV